LRRRRNGQESDALTGVQSKSLTSMNPFSISHTPPKPIFALLLTFAGAAVVIAAFGGFALGLSWPM
jgi:hypothetical protein